MFESFKMTYSIATTCSGYQANLADGNSCELLDNGYKIFNASNEDCDPYGCYHVMVPGVEVFGS